MFAPASTWEISQMNIENFLQENVYINIKFIRVACTFSTRHLCFLSFQRQNIYYYFILSSKIFQATRTDLLLSEYF